jgi:hypothetical protein
MFSVSLCSGQHPGAAFLLLSAIPADDRLNIIGTAEAKYGRVQN